MILRRRRLLAGLIVFYNGQFEIHSYISYQINKSLSGGAYLPIAQGSLTKFESQKILYPWYLECTFSQHIKLSLFDTPVKQQFLFDIQTFVDNSKACGQEENTRNPYLMSKNLRTRPWKYQYHKQQMSLRVY